MHRTFCNKRLRAFWTTVLRQCSQVLGFSEHHPVRRFARAVQAKPSPNGSVKMGATTLFSECGENDWSRGGKPRCRDEVPQRGRRSTGQWFTGLLVGVPHPGWVAAIRMTLPGSQRDSFGLMMSPALMVRTCDERQNEKIMIRRHGLFRPSGSESINKSWIPLGVGKMDKALSSPRTQPSYDLTDQINTRGSPPMKILYKRPGVWSPLPSPFPPRPADPLFLTTRSLPPLYHPRAT